MILAERADVVAILIDTGVDPGTEPYKAGRMAGNKAVQDALKRRPKQVRYGLREWGERH